jgi:hypothetical protein
MGYQLKEWQLQRYKTSFLSHFCNSENDPIGSKYIGCDAWAMTEQTKSSLKARQGKILRKIYGTITHQNGWGIRNDDELHVMCTKQNIVTTIKGRRLELAGHVVRMPHGRTVKKLCLGKPEGRRITGRPKLRWLDCIENDLKWMGVKRWRKKGGERSAGVSS